MDSDFHFLGEIMASSYICDLCNQPISENEEVGHLRLHGINSNVPRRGKRGYNRNHRLGLNLELCSVCTTGAYRALEMLSNPEKQSEKYL
jgi:hypothetical protein